MTDNATPHDPEHPAPVTAGAVVPLMSQDFTAATVTTLRHALEVQVTAAGLTGDVGYDFVLAVHELVTNAVRHGGGHGRLDLGRLDDVLICEITDEGPEPGKLPVRLPAVGTVGGRGLWLAHQLSEGLVLTRGLNGVTATVTACLESAATPAPGSSRPGVPDRRAEEDQR